MQNESHSLRIMSEHREMFIVTCHEIFTAAYVKSRNISVLQKGTKGLTCYRGCRQTTSDRNKHIYMLFPRTCGYCIKSIDKTI